MVLALPLSFLLLIRPKVVYVIVHIEIVNIADGCYTAARQGILGQAYGLAHLHRTAVNMWRICLQHFFVVNVYQRCIGIFDGSYSLLLCTHTQTITPYMKCQKYR